MSKNKPDSHVILRPPATFLCRHCGDSYEMNLPAPIDIMVGASRSFSATHKRCKTGRRGLACIYCYEFGHELLACPLLDYGGDWRKWLAGPDTGSSSKTLCRALAHGVGFKKGEISVPQARSRFSCCRICNMTRTTSADATVCSRPSQDGASASARSEPLRAGPRSWTHGTNLSASTRKNCRPESFHASPSFYGPSSNVQRQLKRGLDGPAAAREV